jgi:hypothetical protein
MRTRSKVLYMPRTLLKGFSPHEVHSKSSFFGWIIPTLRTSEFTVLQIVGLDAVVVSTVPHRHCGVTLYTLRKLIAHNYHCPAHSSSASSNWASISLESVHFSLQLLLCLSITERMVPQKGYLRPHLIQMPAKLCSCYSKAEKTLFMVQICI